MCRRQGFLLPPPSPVPNRWTDEAQKVIQGLVPRRPIKKDLAAAATKTKVDFAPCASANLGKKKLGTELFRHAALGRKDGFCMPLTVFRPIGEA